MSNSLEKKILGLNPGQPVFLLGYHDREMRLPFVEAYVYLGSVQNQEDELSSWFFQRAEAFLKNPIVNFQKNHSDDLLVVDRDGLCTFVDWEGLVAELSERKMIYETGSFPCHTHET